MHNHPESVTSLPPIIAEYFAAANDGRIDDATSCFAENSRVYDEDQNHIGHDSIRAWVAETTQKYQPKTELLRAIETSDTFVATAKVSGNFPGSPADLNYSFTLANQKISTLSIQ